MDKRRNYKRIKELALGKGASLFGVCEFNPDKEKVYLPKDILRTLDRAISMAVRLSDNILEEIVDKPTKLYFHHYRAINLFLDQLAIAVQQFIQKDGFRALPIPASQILDWDRQIGHLSHKRFAEMSAIGWLGRNNIIVSPQYGARIRLTTILTDMPLSVDRPLKEDCGECKDCISVCPASSIKERKEDFDHISCYEKLKNFKKSGYVEQYICGICVKACNGKNK